MMNHVATFYEKHAFKIGNLSYLTLVCFTESKFVFNEIRLPTEFCVSVKFVYENVSMSMFFTGTRF